MGYGYVVREHCGLEILRHWRLPSEWKTGPKLLRNWAMSYGISNFGVPGIIGGVEASTKTSKKVGYGLWV